MRDGTKRLFWPLTLIATACLLAVGTACELDEDDDSDSEPIPVIQPSSAKLVAADQEDIVFTVRGGTPEYTWTVLDGSLGALTEAGDTAIYKSSPVAGQNIVTVTDARSNAVSATITQL